MSSASSAVALWIMNMTGRLIGKIENLIAHSLPALGMLYGKKFYDSLVRKELDLARLKPGGSILHVGCGSLPLTALMLARHGFSVTAVDRDRRAVAAATEFVRSQRREACIHVQQADGETIDASPYDAVWVSLHVFPRRRVLRNLLENMRPEAKLVYRNPMPDGKLCCIYPLVSPGELGHGGEFHSAAADLGKQSVVIEKPYREEGLVVPITSNQDTSIDTCLEDLTALQVAIIFSVPDDPLLAPLGLRPGKRVTVSCRHPFGGPVVVHVQGRRIALGRELARKIRVEDGGVAENCLSHHIAAAEN